MAVELKIPDIGESVTEAVITRWLKAEGERVEKDEPVAELETEKVDVELPAPVSGVLSKISAAEGDTVAVGDVIGIIEEDEAAAAETEETGAAEEAAEAEEEDAGKKLADEKAAAREGEPEEEKAMAGAAEEEEEKGEAEGEPKTEEDKEKDEEKDEEKAEERAEEAEKERQGEEVEKEIAGEIEVRPRVMPAARGALVEHGLRAEEVEGSGPGGRVLKEDVERHVADSGKEKPPAEREEEGEKEQVRRARPDEERAEAGERSGRPGREQETVPMTPIRKRIAKRLVEAQRTSATTTTFNEIDMTAVQELRHGYGERFEEKHDVSLGLMSFFVKAVVDAVHRYPKFNARMREDSIVYHHYCDVGIAVATERGLVVPVIRNAESLGFAEIERRIANLARRARSGDLEVDDLTGGTFTITNGGVFGSLLSTPLLNPPQSAALGMHAIQERPVARDGEVEIRPMMYVALSYDHRLVDGAEAVTFLKRVKQVVEEPARLLLEE